MTSRKSGDLPHVDCIVIDEDTLRYGGSDFRREYPRAIEIEQEARAIGRWANDNLEGCEGEEWEYLCRIVDATCDFLATTSKQAL